MDLSDLGNLGDLAKQMSDAYSAGTDAMNKAGKEVAKDMKPDHEVEMEIKLSAKVEGHDYKVDSTVVFEIELDPVLSAQSGDLSKALDSLDVDLGDDKAAVMEQLGQPRAVGVVKSIETKELKVSDKEGPAKVKLNKDGTLLATINKKQIEINCESVFSFPDNPDLFVAIPSMEKMQKNIVIPLDKLTKKVSFKWMEKDKDNLKVDGSVVIKKK
jgi:hypothetical protein